MESVEMVETVEQKLKVEIVDVSPKKVMSNTSWGTEAEKAYLNRIGRYAERAGLNVPVRKELLKGYLRACANRTNWGRIDRNSVMGHANVLLMNC